MHRGFPLKGVKITAVAAARKVEAPSYFSANWQVNAGEFSMQVEEVGSFYAAGGAEAEYSVLQGADPGWVRLYLNGQVAVALMHQRGMMTLHASSFVHNGKGVMILGESGAGKSSLTASFAIGGAGLLTDDITPVVMKDTRPHIMALHESIRIRKNTAEQLNIDGSLLREAESGTGKQYMKAGVGNVAHHPLDVILRVEVGDVDAPVIEEPLPAEKFSFLRSEICMSELLAGMAETETAYLHQLVRIIEEVPFARVVRPAGIKIADLHSVVERFLDRLPGRG